MNKNGLKFFYVPFLAILCGCLESEEPLCTTQEAVSDRSLVGKWIQSNSRMPARFEILATDNSATMKIIYQEGSSFVGDGTVHDSDKPKQEFDLIICKTKIGYYANIKGTSKYQKSADSKLDRPAYWLYRFSVTNGTLQLSWPSYEVFKRAVKSGKLKGRTWETTWGTNVLLDDKGAKILQWLESPNILKTFERADEYKKES